MTWAQVIEAFTKEPEPVTAKPKASATHKRCKDCEKFLSLDNFYKRDKHGYSSRCRPCYIAYQYRDKTK